MRALAPLGLGIAVALAAIALLGDLRERLGWFVLLFVLAFVCYAVATWRLLRTPAGTSRFWLVLGLAAVFRLIALASPPTLSDDLFRYVWEGRVVLAGRSPYAHPPDDPALAALRDTAIWPRVNNKDIPSPYPPVAQVGGMLAAALTPNEPLGMKLVSLAGDVLTIAALWLLLRRVGAPVDRVLIYAWHPLPALEFAHSAHNDSLMIAPLVLALALVAGPTGLVTNASTSSWRRWAAALLVGIAALAKVTPLLLLPLLPRRLGLLPVAAACMFIAAAWVPLLLLGGGNAGSIVVYLGSWQDNDSVHAVLRELAGARFAKIVTLAALAAGVLAMAAHRALRDRSLWWQAYAALGLSIVLASTVHAWYLTWLLPLLAVELSAQRTAPFIAPWSGLAWLVFSGLVVLPYLTYDTHEWQLWISFAQYVPFYALLAAPLGVKALRRRKTAREVASSAPAYSPNEALSR